MITFTRRASVGARPARLVGLVCTAVLVLTLGVADAAAAAEPGAGSTSSAPAASADHRDEAPDGASASIQAKLSGRRVEDLSRRTESASTFANPDGTWTTQDLGGPVRVLRDGVWRDVDYDLVRQSDGSFAPVRGLGDVGPGGLGCRDRCGCVGGAEVSAGQ